MNKKSSKPEPIKIGNKYYIRDRADHAFVLEGQVIRFNNGIYISDSENDLPLLRIIPFAYPVYNSNGSLVNKPKPIKVEKENEETDN